MKICSKADINCRSYYDGRCIGPYEETCRFAIYAPNKIGDASELYLRYMTKILKNQEEILRKLKELQK